MIIIVEATGLPKLDPDSRIYVKYVIAVYRTSSSSWEPTTAFGILPTKKLYPITSSDYGVLVGAPVESLYCRMVSLAGLEPGVPRGKNWNGFGILRAKKSDVWISL